MKTITLSDSAYEELRKQFEPALAAQAKENSMVDATGRCIPTEAAKKLNVVNANTDFYLEKIDTVDTKYFKLLQEIKDNPAIANLLQAPYYPITLPKLPKDFEYGTYLDDVLLPKLEKAYKKAFPDRTFYNYRHDELSGKVSIVNDRHAALIEQLKKKSLTGLIFPTALQGFSVHAQREQIKLLPKNVSLCGLETIIAATMYPKIFGRDWNTLGYDLSALQWHDSDYSLCCKADGGGFDFGSCDSLGRPDVGCSGSLSVLY